MFASQTQSFLCGKFSIARLEVLPNSRHAGVFQMSTMVNLEIGSLIGFQEPLTRPGVILDEKMSICYDSANSSLLEGDVKVRKCHVMLFLRTCMSRKRM